MSSDSLGKGAGGLYPFAYVPDYLLKFGIFFLLGDVLQRLQKRQPGSKHQMQLDGEGENIFCSNLPRSKAGFSLCLYLHRNGVKAHLPDLILRVFQIASREAAFYPFVLVVDRLIDVYSHYPITLLISSMVVTPLRTFSIPSSSMLLRPAAFSMSVERAF